MEISKENLSQIRSGSSTNQTIKPFMNQPNERRRTSSAILLGQFSFHCSTVLATRENVFYYISRFCGGDFSTRTRLKSTAIAIYKKRESLGTIKYFLRNIVVVFCIIERKVLEWTSCFGFVILRCIQIDSTWRNWFWYWW